MTPMGWDSAVGIVTVHGLEGPVVSRYSDCPWAERPGGRILVGARFSPPIQTGPGAYQAPCTVDTRSLSQG